MTVKRSMMICAAVAAAGLSLAGCGGKPAAEETAADGGSEATASSASSTSANVDPCSFLSAEEVAAVTTDAVTKAVSDDATCTYHSNPGQTLTVTVRPSGGAEAMETVHRAAQLLGGMGAAVADKGGAGADVAAMLKEDKSAGPKLGDEAVWGMNSMLSVRKGDAFVEVTPLLLHDPATHSGYPLVAAADKRTIAQTLAEKVLAKLS